MDAGHGQFLEQLRDKQRTLGLSQSGLAQRLGVSDSAVSLILSRKRPPSWKFVRGVCAVWPEFSAYLAADLASESQRSAAGRTAAVA